MSHPIDEYVDALKLHKKDKRLSAENVAKSLGGDKITEPILNSLDKIFENDSIIHRAVLDTVVQEAKKRERREKSV